MNFSVLDGYFDINSSEDTDTSNYGSYQPPSKTPPIIQFSRIKDNKEMISLKSESDKTRKQLRHLFKLRTAKHKTITAAISKSYRRMHLRIAQITKQFGEAQLCIINWRILFEQKYLSEIKSLMTHFDSYTNDRHQYYIHQQKQLKTVPTVGTLHEESSSSEDNDTPLLLSTDDEKKDEHIFDDNHDIHKEEEEEEKIIEIGGVDTIKLEKLNPKKHIQSINNSDNTLNQCYGTYSMRNKHQKYPKSLDISDYLNKYRKRLEISMNSDKKELKTLCKNLRLELKNEHYLQERQELLVSYEERIGVVLLLFHWFIETNKYQLKSNVYSGNNIAAQLSAQIVKHYYLCNHIIAQIQNKFDCLVLDTRNEIGKQIRIWLKLLSSKDMYHLKPEILLKHINCFIRDFIKSHHYIITDIIRYQHGKYNIEYVIKEHHSVEDIEFKQYIESEQFLCRKNQTQYYYKESLTAVSLRWSLLRLLQRCIYSRLSMICVLPRMHSLPNVAKNKLIRIPSFNRNKKGFNTSNTVKEKTSARIPKVIQDNNDDDIDLDDTEEKYGTFSHSKHKRTRIKKPMAMQMVSLDGKSSMDDDVEYAEYVDHDISDIMAGDRDSLLISVPTFNIYGLPRNSEYEYELLDQHFFNQCGWMRNLSPYQLGIEDIYWCDTPPLMLHANSDILINVKETESIDHSPNKWNRDHSPERMESSSMSELYGSWNTQKHLRKSSDNTPIQILNTKTRSADIEQNLLLPPTRGIHRSNSTKTPFNDYNDDDEFSYDYSVRPFGDALALIECLDELTAPHDMNECLGYVVDVIFRTAQSYRKSNIHKQTKLERYHLDLSSLAHYDKKDNNNEDKHNNKKKKKKKKKKKCNESEESLSSINGEAAIGADVFFPLFIWVIVHSKIRNIHRSVFIMSHYNDSDAMKTKVGYNVSTLHSALDHIMKADKKLYIGQKFRR